MKAVGVQVMFIISNIPGLNTGAGGHYYSLRTTVEALGPYVTPSVLVIGRVPERIFDQLECTIHVVPVESRSLRSTYRQVEDIVASSPPQVIHAFDLIACYLARRVAMARGLGVIYTKCGGPNPRYFFPHVDTLILYTRENERWARARYKLRNTNIELIPNRLGEVAQDEDRIAKLRKIVAGKGAVFLRIGRFSRSYQSTLLQGVDLVRDLNQDGIACYILMIGAPEDPDVVERARSAAGEYGAVVVEPEFTRNASELIDVGDFVVGTGRGIMEASARGRPLLTPMSNAPHPVLIGPGNFERLFATNFSPRNYDPDHNADANYTMISEAVRDKQTRMAAASFSKELHEKWFDIHAVLERYIQIFQRVSKEGRKSRPSFYRRVDLFLHWVRIRVAMRNAHLL